MAIKALCKNQEFIDIYVKIWYNSALHGDVLTRRVRTLTSADPPLLLRLNIVKKLTVNSIVSKAKTAVASLFGVVDSAIASITPAAANLAYAA